MYEYLGQCEVVHDGDTVKVLLDQGLRHFQRVDLRLVGINAPELWTPEGKLAAAHLAELVGTLPASVVVRTVKPLIRREDPDKYGGRWDGRFWLESDGTWGPDNNFVVTVPSLNERMVADGFAVLYAG